MKQGNRTYRIYLEDILTAINRISEYIESFTFVDFKRDNKTVDAGIKTSRIQAILDYLRFEELSSKSTATENDVDVLLKKVKKGRWNRAKKDLGLND